MLPQGLRLSRPTIGRSQTVREPSIDFNLNFCTLSQAVCAFGTLSGRVFELLLVTFWI